jgi:hypothetical protein
MSDYQGEGSDYNIAIRPIIYEEPTGIFRSDKNKKIHSVFSPQNQ